LQKYKFLSFSDSTVFFFYSRDKVVAFYLTELDAVRDSTAFKICKESKENTLKQAGVELCQAQVKLP
jgi:hypothetical protein